jgi:uncharacterized protein YyaL (SSP411 family)
MRPLIIAVLILSLAYLAFGADAPTTQPIAWRGWSDDIFAQAKKEHKFVILDMEAVWCHWCHVMDETTYRDPLVDKLMASKYIAVKVDQDSRPDLSNRYEDFGWPATVVFGEDGKEIAIRQGYIEPASMASMLQAIIDDPTPGPSVRAVATIHAAGPSLSDDVRKELIRRNNVTYDEKYGAWGTIQKFMDWDAVEFCMSLAAKGDAHAEHMAKGTLTGQLHLIDPVWGGVYQYSTDGDWDHPHFEKIMQMQAEDLRTYANAYAMWHDPVYLQAAQDIHKFLVNFLRSPDGVFYTSMDADLHDGEHSAAYFALDDAGRRAQGVPRVDKHVYSRENGWTINALATFYAATGKREYLDEATTAANWIIANRSIPGGGFRHGENDPAGPYLGDTLSMGRAMLELYCVTADRAWLKRAQDAADFIAAHFTASDAVGVATSEINAPGPFRPRPELDENVMAARFANLLFHYSGVAADRKLAEVAMSYLAAPPIAESRGSMVAGILLADAEMTTDPLHVVIVGKKSDPNAQSLFATAMEFCHPYKRQEWYDSSEGPLPNADVQYPDVAKAAAFICTGSACSSPAYTTDDLQKKLARAASR